MHVNVIDEVDATLADEMFRCGTYAARLKTPDIGGCQLPSQIWIFAE